MASDFVFLATLGQTDIQVEVGIAGNKRRISVGKKSTRKFQDACRKQLLAWEMLSFRETECLPEERGPTVDFLEKENACTIFGKAFDKDNRLSFPIRLCSPLLSNAWRQIQGFQEKGILGKPLGVLLFSTERPDIGPHAQSEPVGVFELVKKTLAEALGLTETQIHPCVYLKDGDFNEMDERQQVLLRSDVAESIHKAIQNIHLQYPDSHVVIANVGGLPDITHLVSESAFYWFGADNTLFSKPSGSQGTPLIQKPEKLIPPIEKINARRRILDLIREGSFDAALRLAVNLEYPLEREKRKTTRFLQVINQFLFEGANPDPNSNLPVFKEFLQKSGRFSPLLRMGFRIEADLRSGALIHALQNVYTFSDIAFWMFAEKEFSGKSGCIDWTNHCLDIKCAVLPRETSEAYAELNPKTKEPRIPLGKYLKDNTVKGISLKRVLRSHLPPQTLQAIDKMDEALLGFKFVRNTATHGFIKGTTLKKAIDGLRDEKVWRYPDNSDHLFLNSPVPLQIFNLLGIQDPGELYERFIQAISLDIHAMPLD